MSAVVSSACQDEPAESLSSLHDFSSTAVVFDAAADTLSGQALVDVEFGSVGGDALTVPDCQELTALDFDTLSGRDYTRALSYNEDCAAVGLYMGGRDAKNSFFRDDELEDWVPNLPNAVLPDLSGDGILDTAQPVGSASDYAVARSSPGRVVFRAHGFDVDVRQLALRDVDGDGSEDAILRFAYGVPDGSWRGHKTFFVSRDGKGAPFQVKSTTDSGGLVQ